MDDALVPHPDGAANDVAVKLRDAVLNQVDPQAIGAFFDVDETLVRGASAYWAAKEMFRRSFFGFNEVAFAARQTFTYLLFGESKGKIGDFSDRAARIVAGNSIEDLQKVGEEIYRKYFVPKVYRTTYDLLRQHVEAGHSVYLISATPWIIAEEFAKQLGAMGGIGTRTKVLDGLIVGEVDGRIIHGEAKVDAVLEVASESSLDLAASWAYSDSANDIPMLSLVGNPVAVNPDRGLRAYAKAHDWQILNAHEAKDVAKRIALRVLLSGAVAGLGYAALVSGRKGTRTFRGWRAGGR